MRPISGHQMHVANCMLRKLPFVQPKLHVCHGSVQTRRLSPIFKGSELALSANPPFLGSHGNRIAAGMVPK